MPGDAVWTPTLDRLHSFNSDPWSCLRPHFVEPYLHVNWKRR